MTTLEIEIAMMNYIGVRQNIIVPGISWGMTLGNKSLHECDLLSLTKSNYATEIEIKISRADLKKDKHKKHGHNHNHIKYLWFAVPEKLKDLALEEIPERAGLYVLDYYRNGRIYVSVARQATVNPKAEKWTDAERQNLMRLGAMRILNLKKLVQKLKKKISKL